MRPDEHLRDTNTATQIVIADTSPLNYLVQIDCDFLLPFLYQRVVVPPSVIAELSHERTPEPVARWAASPPIWIEVSPLQTLPDAGLSVLDPGERDAIQLALELGIATILIDERRGRQEARSRGLSIVGTIGVLVAAHRARFIDAREAFDRLEEQTTFHTTPALRLSFLEALSATEANGS